MHKYKKLSIRFFNFFFNFFLFVVDFVIHWNETAMGLHVFPIPIIYIYIYIYVTIIWRREKEINMWVCKVQYHLDSFKPYDVGIIITPTLKIRSLGFRLVESLVQVSRLAWIWDLSTNLFWSRTSLSLHFKSLPCAVERDKNLGWDINLPS